MENGQRRKGLSVLDTRDDCTISSVNPCFRLSKRWSRPSGYCMFMLMFMPGGWYTVRNGWVSTVYAHPKDPLHLQARYPLSTFRRSGGRRDATVGSGKAIQ